MLHGGSVRSHAKWSRRAPMLIRCQECMGGARGKSLRKKLRNVSIPHHHGNTANGRDTCLSWGCSFCRARGRSQADSHIFPAAWGNRWWCRRSSAGFVTGRSWSFHLAVSCSCLESTVDRQKKGQLGKRTHSVKNQNLVTVKIPEKKSAQSTWPLKSGSRRQFRVMSVSTVCLIQLAL